MIMNTELTSQQISNLIDNAEVGDRFPGLTIRDAKRMQRYAFEQGPVAIQIKPDLSGTYEAIALF